MLDYIEHGSIVPFVGFACRMNSNYNDGKYRIELLFVTLLSPFSCIVSRSHLVP